MYFKKCEGFTEKFKEAVAHYSEETKTDIENDYVKQHADEYIFCYEHGKDLIDLDFWCDYQDLLDEKITYDEYAAIDEYLDGSPFEYSKDDVETIDLLRVKLQEYRDATKSVDGILSDARERSEAIGNNEYFKENDEWFTYYVNAKTGDKKFKLAEGDIEVKAPGRDDFYR